MAHICLHITYPWHTAYNLTSALLVLYAIYLNNAVSVRSQSYMFVQFLKYSDLACTRLIHNPSAPPTQISAYLLQLSKYCET